MILDTASVITGLVGLMSGAAAGALVTELLRRRHDVQRRFDAQKRRAYFTLIEGFSNHKVETLGSALGQLALIAPDSVFVALADLRARILRGETFEEYAPAMAELFLQIRRDVLGGKTDATVQQLLKVVVEGGERPPDKIARQP
ncbi:MAG: hypothetical protein L6Q92_16600 [Phycisphaerae bacterium]|nr:hypothetical protein [Phycisphaerae bacterium]